MNTNFSNRSKFLLFILFGIIFGILLLLIINNPSRWSWFFVAGIAVLWLVVINPDLKLALVVIFVLAIPLNSDLIFGYRLHAGGAKGWTISLIDIPLLFLYIIWIIETAIQHKNNISLFPEVILPLLGFILVGIISLLKAKSISLGLFQIFIYIKKLLAVIYIGNHVKTKQSLKWILTALFIGFSFESIIGFLQYTIQSNVGFYILGERSNGVDMFLPGASEGIPRVSGTFWHSNGFAIYLQMVIPVGLGIFLLGTKGIHRLLIGALATIGVIPLILTFSRGAWISFLFSLVCLVLLYLRKSRNNLRTIKWIVFIIIILIGIFVLFGKLIYLRLVSEDYGAAHSRIPMIKTAWNIIKHQPMIGIGINNYAETMIDYDVTGDSFSRYRPVHNLFLLIAAETGLSGLILFLLTIGAAIWKGLKAMNSINSLRAGAMLGIISGIIGFVGHAQVDFVLLDYMNVFWLYLGLICALAYRIE